MNTLTRHRTPTRIAPLALSASLCALLAACATETIVYERAAPTDALYDAPSTATPVYEQTASGVITVQTEPPLLPDYDQPPCPQDGYLWTPGYWAWSGGYYWVPGTWVTPPVVGFLWTPAYWGYDRGFYVFHAGYWGTHVGFYGGIN